MPHPVTTGRGRYGGITLATDYRTSVAGVDDEMRALLALVTETTPDAGIGDVL